MEIKEEKQASQVEILEGEEFESEDEGLEGLKKDENVTDTEIAQGVRLSMLSSREGVNQAVAALSKRLNECNAENHALKLDLSEVLQDRDSYRRMLDFESGKSKDVLAQFLALLSKYNSLVSHSTKQVTASIEASSKFAAGVKYGIVAEDVSEELRAKLARLLPRDEFEHVIGLIKSVKKLAKPSPGVQVAVPTIEGKGTGGGT